MKDRFQYENSSESEQLDVGDLILAIDGNPCDSDRLRETLSVQPDIYTALTVDRGTPHPEVFSHARHTFLAPPNARYVEVDAEHAGDILLHLPSPSERQAPPPLFREDYGLFHNGRARRPAIIKAVGKVRPPAWAA